MASYRSSIESSAVVPAIDTASSTAAIQSLGRRGIRTIAVSEKDSPPGASSKYCDEVVPVPDPTVDLGGYEESLLALALRDDVETILPFRELDIYLLARNKRALAGRVGTPWPSLELLRMVQDRVELFRAANAADVSTPKTRTVDEWDDWSREVIVKPRFTVHAAEYSDFFTESHAQWSSTQYLPPGDVPECQELVDEMGHAPLVQEFVPSSDEYAFFALYDRGEAVATFQHRQRRGWKYCGGPSAYRESVAIPELEAAGRRLLDELEWHGVAMVEFLRHPETDEFQLMEINPRFWSSLPFTVQAGVDFPSLYWSQALGQPIDPDPDYDVGVAGHLLRGELLHLHSILTEDYPLAERPSFWKTAVDVGASIARHRRFDYLSLDDPGPFVRDVRNLLGGLREDAESEPSDRAVSRPIDLKAEASESATEAVDPPLSESETGGQTFRFRR